MTVSGEDVISTRDAIYYPYSYYGILQATFPPSVNETSYYNKTMTKFTCINSVENVEHYLATYDRILESYH